MVKKILLADDEEGFLDLLSATLRNDDRYILLLARNGEEALRIARREKPDLLFLDVVMPKMDGYQVCQALKEDPATAQVKVIFLTALAQQADRQRATEAGADDYFTKPFSPTALLNEVENLFTIGPSESWSLPQLRALEEQSTGSDILAGEDSKWRRTR